MPAPAKQRMRRAIARLPEPTGTVYRLHLFAGLDYWAIATCMALGVTDVERRIAEAIALIDDDLRAQEREAAQR